MTMPKHPILVVYDYGQGGVWAKVNAGAEGEIVSKYPFFSVVRTRPEWMTDETFDRLETLDIDDAPTGWIAKALEELK